MTFMRRLAFGLLSVFVFSLPWEQSVVLPGIGSATRLAGLVAVCAAGLAVLVSGRVRQPGVVLGLAVTFLLMTLLSVFWTISPEDSAGRLATYVQLLGLVWLVWEFARSKVEHERLLIAYCLGGYVAMTQTFANFAQGGPAVDSFRYAARNFDPNDFGLTLAIGIPMAWQLFLSRRGFIRLFGAIYLPASSVAILLTGSRAAFLSGTLALTIIPLTMHRSLRSWAIVLSVVLLAAASAVVVVPQASWDRIFTTREELTGGIGGRWVIWMAGWEVFQGRPLLGTGAGTFEVAVEDTMQGRSASHNMLLAVLVEQGISGFVVFVALILTSALMILRLTPPARLVWIVITATWLVGTMSLSWQYSKVTWLVFALVAVNAARDPRPAAAWSRSAPQLRQADVRRRTLVRPVT